MRKIDKILIDRDKIQNQLNSGVKISDLAKEYDYCKSTSLKIVLLNNGFDVYNEKTGEKIEHIKSKFHCKHCGKEFDDKYKLGGHVTTCKANPNYNNNLNNLAEGRLIKHEQKIKEKKEYFCKFCGKVTFNKGACVVHENSCKKNPNRVPHPNGDRTYAEGRVAWNKGKTALTDERVYKYQNTRKDNFEKGLFVMKGKPHTQETKSLLRQKMISFITNNGTDAFGQHFSKRGCDYIDKLNEINNWNLQHALNGGEYEIDGYFLDGYDKERNIAFEYDEKRHYKDVYNNVLREKDIERQNRIIECLECKFYRYNEVLDLFYEVN